MEDKDSIAANKALVRSFYEGGTDSTGREYGQIFDPRFMVSVPDYLPWGGVSDLPAYLDDVLPQVTVLLDFKRCRIESLVAEGDRVVILIDIGLIGTTDSVQISEHWQLLDGKALALWVAYFEPAALLALIQSGK